MMKVVVVMVMVVIMMMMMMIMIEMMGIFKVPTLRLKALYNTDKHNGADIYNVHQVKDCCQSNIQLTHNVHINTDSNVTDYMQNSHTHTLTHTHTHTHTHTRTHARTHSRTHARTHTHTHTHTHTLYRLIGVGYLKYLEKRNEFALEGRESQSARNGIVLVT